jgi:ribosomal protein L19E
VGHFCRAEVGHFWRALKGRSPVRAKEAHLRVEMRRIGRCGRGSRKGLQSVRRDKPVRWSR